MFIIRLKNTVARHHFFNFLPVILNQLYSTMLQSREVSN